MITFREYLKESESTEKDFDLEFNLRGRTLLEAREEYKWPDKVPGYFDIGSNNLTSLEGCPNEVGDRFSCSSNPLTGLEGCPIKVGSYFACTGTNVTSLQGFGEMFRYGWIKGRLYLPDTLKSHLLSVILIPELTRIDFWSSNKHLQKVEEIVNKHLASKEKDLLECQDELIENGFKEFARL